MNATQETIPARYSHLRLGETHSIVVIANAMDLTNAREMDVGRSVVEHDAWFNQIGLRLDARRHEGGECNDYAHRVFIQRHLDAYNTQRRARLAR